MRFKVLIAEDIALSRWSTDLALSRTSTLAPEGRS
jgi:hypothetical protein